MASTPAEGRAARKLRALPRYRPWFYDLVRGTSALLLRSVFRLRTRGSRTCRSQGGVVLAPMHRSYIDTLAVGVSFEGRRFRAMAKYGAVPRAAPRAGDRARRRLPGQAPRRAGHGGLRGGDAACCATGTCCSCSPRAPATATARRGRSWAPRGSRSRRARRFVPVSIAGSDRIKLLPPRFPKIRVLLRRADPARRPAGRRSAPRVAHGDEALDAPPSRRASRCSRQAPARLRRRAGRAGAGGARAARPGATRARGRPGRSRRSRT